MFLQAHNSDFIISIIKEVEAHEARSHWKLMKKNEVNNKHTNKYGNLKTLLSVWYFMWKVFPDGGLMKHKFSLCAHVVMQQWGVKYWKIIRQW